MRLYNFFREFFGANLGAWIKWIQVKASYEIFSAENNNKIGYLAQLKDTKLGKSVHIYRGSFLSNVNALDSSN